MLEIAKKYSKNKEITNIPGTVLNYNGRIKNNGKREYIKDIHQVISNNQKAIIDWLIQKKVISYSRRRLPLDNIGEGEWLLPIYVLDRTDPCIKQLGELLARCVCEEIDLSTRQLLEYVKVSIKWTSEGAKATDETGQQASKTTDADKKSPSPET